MRKKISEYILLITIGLLLFSFQISVLNNVPIINTHINCLLVFAICFTSIGSSPSQKLTVCLFSGLLMDIWSSSFSFYTIGLLMFYSIINYISKNLHLDKISITIIMVFLGTLAIELVNASFIGFYSSYGNSFYTYKDFILHESIVNMIFLVIIFPVIKLIFVKKKNEII